MSASVRHDVVRILTEWFGPAPHRGTAELAKTKWFAGGAELDSHLRSSFEPLVDQALAGDLDDSFVTSWRALSPTADATTDAAVAESSLALLVLCDQWTRNIKRGTKAAFAGDERAFRTSEWLLSEGVRARLWQPLSPLQKMLVGLPLMHREDAAVQRRSVEYYEQLTADVEAEAKRGVAEAEDALGILGGVPQFARDHETVVKQFGRFPRRNEALGRESTAEERDFLANTKLAF